MESLLFRVPGEARAWHDLAGRLFARGEAGRGVRLHVDGRSWRDGDRALPAGALVRVEGGDAPPDPAAAIGPADTYLALVPAPPWRRGRLSIGHGAWASYALGRERAGVAELSLGGAAMPARAVLRALAKAGMPALGDARRGGVLVRGGLRLVPVSAPAGERAGPGVRSSETSVAPSRADARAALPADWWPEEPVFPGLAAWPGGPAGRAPGRAEPAAAGPALGRASGAPRWIVSRAAARAVRSGHPWFLPDPETEAVARWRPGTWVEAVERGDGPVGLALVDGDGPVAARIWSRAAGRGAREAGAGVEARVAAALARRAGCLGESPAVGGEPLAADGARPQTDALRLIHGEADGLPGLAVDRLGPLLRVLVTGPGAARALIDPVVSALRAAASPLLPDPTERAVVVVLHLRGDTGGRHECVRFASDADAAIARRWLDTRGRLRVHERGLAFVVDPGLGDPEHPRPGVGLYLDQRENRARLSLRARGGGRWLNLFAHTGAFSVALLAAGAEAVVSVDLSKPYLDWLEENLAINGDAGLDAARHRSVRRDGRRFIDELPRGERFAGIVLDPPTAAAAGRRFWSARRDLEPLVGEALARLEPGGALLVSRNQRRARPDLGELVRNAAGARRVRLAAVEPADPGPDFPRLPDFREGDSFRGVIAVRA